VVTNVRSPAVSKQVAQKYDVEIFNLRNLSGPEVTKQYQINISRKFAVLENLHDSENINTTWENRISKPQLNRVQVCMN
jgi:ribosomal protein S25